jgi:8-oxo-dGTP diphosphatase
MPKKPYCYEYPRPMVTVDVVIVTREERRRVLLIRRKSDPFQGKWALPGGFVNMDEDLEDAARRELMEETSVATGKLEQLATFGTPGRDPRGRTISVVFLAAIRPADAKATAGDDAAEAAWHPLGRLPELAFDHAEILALAKKRLKTGGPR